MTAAEQEANTALRAALKAMAVAEKLCREAGYGSLVISGIFESAEQLAWVVALVEGKA